MSKVYERKKAIMLRRT